MTKALLIAATGSARGKTSLTLGLLAALRLRKLRVAPFKTGPDFIDPGLHRLACGTTSHNLDSWMLSEAANQEILLRYAQGADVAVVEGAMGLFDGISGTDEAGSAAHMAKLLGLPVLLVIDASGMARSAAAVAQGFARFDPQLLLAGVVFNRVASPNHRDILAGAMAGTGIPVMGYLTRDPHITLPSRHLGLVTAGDLEASGPSPKAPGRPGRPDSPVLPDEAPYPDGPDMPRKPNMPDWLHRLAAWVEAGIDVDALLASLPEYIFAGLDGFSSQPLHSGFSSQPLAVGDSAAKPPKVFDGGSRGETFSKKFPPWPPEASPPPSSPLFSPSSPSSPTVHLGVSQDRAFCFCYAENLRLLEAAGAELVFFSPLDDACLPGELDGLYLVGGYPELHAGALSANTGMLASVRAFCVSGRPVYAECGGFMYLMEGLIDREGLEWPMAGVFGCRARMGERFAALGYREAVFQHKTPLGPAGTAARGHEFHYSRLDALPDTPAVYSVSGRKGGREGTLDIREGWLSGNVLASYIHLHFGSNPQLAENFIAAMAETRKKSGQ